MGLRSWFGRGARSGGAQRPGRADRKAVLADLAEWAERRRGVEVFVEPKTAVTETSVVLVAADGEFTRRRVPSPQAARAFAHDHRLPVYDATIVGYPQRMRDYSRRQNILERRAREQRG